MTAATHVLVLFVAWTVLIAFGYVGYRVALVLGMKERANAWTRGAQEHKDPAWVTRFHHAHLNCLETLPLYASVVVAAYITGQLSAIDPLAYVFLAARVAQSTIHVISTAPLMVFLRANALIVQIALLVYWVVSLLG